MVSECGRFVLAYNGAIYNFRDLRAELEAAGERFRSQSDTEVLLASLRREGSRVLERLVGMFAFALWDRREQSLTRMAMRVARDVQNSGRSQLLEPMNPFDRRLVHSAISELEDVSTESQGDGPYKQIRVTYTGSAYQHR